VAWKHVPLE